MNRISKLVKKYHAAKISEKLTNMRKQMMYEMKNKHIKTSEMSDIKTKG